jgi:hypothetical protein
MANSKSPTLDNLPDDILFELSLYLAETGDIKELSNVNHRYQSFFLREELNIYKYILRVKYGFCNFVEYYKMHNFEKGVKYRPYKISDLRFILIIFYQNKWKNCQNDFNKIIKFITAEKLQAIRRFDPFIIKWIGNPLTISKISLINHIIKYIKINPIDIIGEKSKEFQITLPHKLLNIFIKTFGYQFSERMHIRLIVSNLRIHNDKDIFNILITLPIYFLTELIAKLSGEQSIDPLELWLWYYFRNNYPNYSLLIKIFASKTGLYYGKSEDEILFEIKNYID